MREVRSKQETLARPILKDENVVRYLQDQHNRYVIVPIDKAANNISIICKRFYVLQLLKKVGAIGGVDPTYEISNTNPVDLINEDVMLCERFGLTIEKDKRHFLLCTGPRRCTTPLREPDS